MPTPTSTTTAKIATVRPTLDVFWYMAPRYLETAEPAMGQGAAGTVLRIRRPGDLCGIPCASSGSVAPARRCARGAHRSARTGRGRQSPAASPHGGPADARPAAPRLARRRYQQPSRQGERRCVGEKLIEVGVGDAFRRSALPRARRRRTCVRARRQRGGRESGEGPCNKGANRE